MLFSLSKAFFVRVHDGLRYPRGTGGRRTGQLRGRRKSRQVAGSKELGYQRSL